MVRYQLRWGEFLAMTLNEQRKSPPNLVCESRESNPSHFEDVELFGSGHRYKACEIVNQQSSIRVSHRTLRFIDFTMMTECEISVNDRFPSLVNDIGAI
jgi:hypothetical protein